MNTTFSYGVRMLMCNNCGAPLQVAPTGGTVECNYCKTANQVAVRDERSVLAMAPHPPANEQERLIRLRSQDGQPLLPPPALASLFGPGGAIPAWKMQEALTVWQTTRNELRQTGSYEAGERLLFLTMTLSNVFSEQQELVRQRAMFESAFEVFNLPRHRQMMLGLLSRNAARIGDLASAERWLSLCDPQSDDLQSDTSYRMSLAALGTSRRDWNMVLQALGPNSKEVPIMDAFDAQAAVLRANAWEQLGQLPSAVGLLQEWMHRAGAQGRDAVGRIIAACPEWQLCPASFPQATAAHEAAAGQQAAASVGGGVGGLLFGLAVLMDLIGTVLVVVGLVTKAGTLVAGISLLATGAFMLLFAIPLRRSAQKAARLRLHGIKGTGRVMGLSPTGMSINNVPQVRIDLTVEVEGQAPYQASAKLLLNPMAAAQLQPGAMVAVRVDPQDPQSLIIETD